METLLPPNFSYLVQHWAKFPARPKTQGILLCQSISQSMLIECLNVIWMRSISKHKGSVPNKFSLYNQMHSYWPNQQRPGRKKKCLWYEQKEKKKSKLKSYNCPFEGRWLGKFYSGVLKWMLSLCEATGGHIIIRTQSVGLVMAWFSSWNDNLCHICHYINIFCLAKTEGGCAEEGKKASLHCAADRVVLTRSLHELIKARAVHL